MNRVLLISCILCAFVAAALSNPSQAREKRDLEAVKQDVKARYLKVKDAVQKLIQDLENQGFKETARVYALKALVYVADTTHSIAEKTNYQDSKLVQGLLSQIEKLQAYLEGSQSEEPSTLRKKRDLEAVKEDLKARYEKVKESVQKLIEELESKGFKETGRVYALKAVAFLADAANSLAEKTNYQDSNLVKGLLGQLEKLQAYLESSKAEEPAALRKKRDLEGLKEDIKTRYNRVKESVQNLIKELETKGLKETGRVYALKAVVYLADAAHALAEKTNYQDSNFVQGLLAQLENLQKYLEEAKSEAVASRKKRDVKEDIKALYEQVKEATQKFLEAAYNNANVQAAKQKLMELTNKLKAYLSGSETN